MPVGLGAPPVDERARAPAGSDSRPSAPVLVSLHVLVCGQPAHRLCAVGDVAYLARDVLTRAAPVETPPKLQGEDLIALVIGYLVVVLRGRSGPRSPCAEAAEVRFDSVPTCAAVESRLAVFDETHN